MRRNSAAYIWLILAASAWGAEQTAPAQQFEAVAAPEVNLKLPKADEIPTTSDAKPPVPASAESPPPAASKTPEWWDRNKGALNQALDQTTGGGGAATQPDAQTQSRGTARSLAQGTIAFCVVIALILILYYAASRYGKRTPLLAGAGLGQVLGRVFLSPKAALYFVRVKNRVLVVGVTQNEISRVAEFDATLFELPMAAQAAPAAAPAATTFLKELAARAQAPKKEPVLEAIAEPPVDDEIAALRNDLERLQQYLQESTRDPGR